MRHPFPFAKNQREPKKGENVLNFMIKNKDFENFVEPGIGIYVEYDYISDDLVAKLKSFKDPEVIKVEQRSRFFYFVIAEKGNSFEFKNK
jgi:hypothetical protein